MVDDEEMAKGPKSPLTIARERKGLNRSQLARLAGTYSQMIDRLETIPGRLKADWAVKLAPLLDVKPKSLIFPEGESETSFASGRIPEGAESDNPEPSNLRSLENIEEHLVHFAEWAILSVGRESLALATDDQVRLWLRELVGLYEAHLIEQQRIAEVRKRVLTQAEPRTSPPEHGRGKDQK